MADIIRPFRATHYNPSFFKNLSAFTCPPYDVISKKQLSLLKRKSPYNFSNILIATNNDYKEIGERLRSWIDKRILVDDPAESIFLYEQRFRIGTEKYKRFGFLSLLKMNQKGAIFPHEYTLSAPKEDRKKVIEEVEANLSPIFVIAPKKINYFHALHNRYCTKKPFMRFKDLDANENLVWKITDKDTIKKICSQANGKNLVIADGHHRFEVASGYYKRNKRRFKNLNYIMSYITDAQRGLVILPTHRVISVPDFDGALATLKQYFDIKEVKNDNVLTGHLGKEKKFSFGVYRRSKFYFLKLKNETILDKLFPASPYKKLNTYLLHQFVLPMLKTDGSIQYTHDIKEAEKLAGHDKTAFILKPVSLSAVFDIANRGYRLPQKSTYFYPKVYSGIAIRRFANANIREF
ncbi:MAG: DUF1015 domain-containing protein [Candidatus Omnitrophica bacterium]|jgi:uncharacterized protein (DUF1015 family)|nr:DUF1015 domain-containing protein [Candidatus Omnitrophota bacterium]